LSLGAFVGVYWSLYGLKFGFGFAVQILVHELGHYIDIKRRGLPADLPVFLPGMGAFVRWQALGVSLETRAAVSLAGPLAILGESVFLLLALGAAWRLFTKDFPEESSPSTVFYFVAVVSALAVLMWVLPAQGLGKF